MEVCMEGIKELYKVGRGPSSSHTLAPERACNLFTSEYGAFPYYEVELFGSLSLTGKGHHTDKIIEETLPGEVTIIFSLDWEEEFPNGFYLKAFNDNKDLVKSWTVFSLGGGSIKIKEFETNLNDDIYKEKSFKEIVNYINKNDITILDYIYGYEKDLKEYLYTVLNAMIISVDNGLTTEGVLPGKLHMERSAKKLYESIMIDTNYLENSIYIEGDKKIDRFKLSELLSLNENQKEALNIVLEWASEYDADENGEGLYIYDLEDLQACLEYVEDHLIEISSIYGYVSKNTISVIRRKVLQLKNNQTKRPYDECSLNNANNDLIRMMAYAYAASEENADGKTCVTAPTLGACGVMAALAFYALIDLHIDAEKIVDALAVGGLFGNLIKTNATISGAVGGCQAEVGAAVSMASAAFAYLMDLNINQIEYAAEIGMEHNLGLTCDPVLGYVMIPCIERNAMGILRAYDAAILSKHMSKIREHLVSFDMVVETMNETGKQIPIELKETSIGGLAKEFNNESK